MSDDWSTAHDHPFTEGADSTQGSRYGESINFRSPVDRNAVRIEFEDADLERLAADSSFLIKALGSAETRGFRKVVAIILRAADEQELRSFKALRVEKLQGDRKG